MTTSRNGDKIVVWANAVVDARYSLSVPEQRLILWLAAQIEREDDALEYRTIGVLEMEELAGRDGAPGGNIYKRLEAVCEKLMTRVLHICLDEKTGKRSTIHWVHRCDYNDNEGTITLRFDDELKPALLQIKTLFAQIPLKTVFKLRGGYAIRWYEMLKAKERGWVLRSTSFHQSRICGNVRLTYQRPSWTRKRTSRLRTSPLRPAGASQVGPSR